MSLKLLKKPSKCQSIIPWSSYSIKIDMQNYIKTMKVCKQMFLGYLQLLSARKRRKRKPIPYIGINLNNIHIYCTKLGRTFLSKAFLPQQNFWTMI